VEGNQEKKYAKCHPKCLGTKNKNKEEIGQDDLNSRPISTTPHPSAYAPFSSPMNLRIALITSGVHGLPFNLKQ
jgi:hypothetical protein